MNSLAGQLLIASPALLDSNFARSVALMIQHDEDQALGLVLNRPSKTTVAAGWAQVSDVPCTRGEMLRQGGPCEGPLMALHADGDSGEPQLLPEVYFSADADRLAWLVAHDEIPARFFVGYSGWGPGQLESELATGAWLTLPATAAHVFDANPTEDQWVRAMRLLVDSVRENTVGGGGRRPFDPTPN